MGTVSKSLALLTPRERKTGIFLLLLSIIKGFADMLGVAAISPFLAVFSSPEIVQSNPYLAWAYDAFGFTSTNRFLMALGVLVIVIITLSAIIRAVTVYIMNRWTEMREYYLSRRLLEVFLRQPYEYYLTHRTTEMSSSILALARNAVIGSYQPLTEIVSGVVTILFILGLLIWTSPGTTLIAALVIGGSYGVLYIALRDLNRRIGHTLVETNNSRFQIVNESLQGVKQIKLSGRAKFFLEKFAAPSLEQAKARAAATIIRQVPRFGLEVVTFGGIIILTLVLLQRTPSGESATAHMLPVLGVYALASYRLMPVVQIVYGAMTRLRSSGPVVDAVYAEMQARTQLPPLPTLDFQAKPTQGRLEFRNVRYSYPKASAASVVGADFVIEPGMSVGLVGPTGAGKTTMVDLMLGLLPPSAGQILVDGEALSDGSLRQWQSNVGYVPQDIHINDASVAENIAMGFARDEICQTRLEHAARLARISDVIESDMEHGYDTMLGERGSRLSGGQRQRLGIARALYHDPSVIVFDEATSALDGATEQKVMEAINGLCGMKTIIMIAHRISTIRNCDKILVLERGKITGFDDYDSLLSNHKTFQNLAASGATS